MYDSTLTLTLVESAGSTALSFRYFQLNMARLSHQNHEMTLLFINMVSH